MEYALLLYLIDERAKTTKFVLILIVMEYALLLFETKYSNQWKQQIVLILIVMEYALLRVF